MMYRPRRQGEAKCPVCAGTGKVYCGALGIPVTTPCTVCKASGTLGKVARREALRRMDEERKDHERYLQRLDAESALERAAKGRL